MRRYETIFIFDPDLSEEQRQPLIDRFQDIMHQSGGGMIQLDPWGHRKLAYEIKKKPRGYYLRADYGGTGAAVDEIERLCRIDDRVLKYMTILLAETVDVEQVKAEIASAAARKAEASSQEKSEAEPKPEQPEADSPEPTPEPADPVAEKQEAE